MSGETKRGPNGETLGVDGPAQADAHRDLLERNGYNAVKAATLTAAKAAGNVPPEAIDAAIDYTERAIERLRVSLEVGATPARRQAEYELRVLNACRAFRLELGRIDADQATRDRIQTR